MAKRVVAITGIIIMAGLYVMTFVFALCDLPNWQTLFGASLVATIGVPILIWIITWAIKKMENKGE